MVTTAGKGIDQQQAMTLVTDFFNFLHQQFVKGAAPNTQELEKYLAKNFTLHNNGHVITKSAADYVKRFQNFLQNYSSFKIGKPIQELFVAGNKLCVYYKIDLTTKGGEQRQVYIMAIGTIENNHIAEWVEVSNEKAIEVLES